MHSWEGKEPSVRVARFADAVLEHLVSLDYRQDLEMKMWHRLSERVRDPVRSLIYRQLYEFREEDVYGK